MSHAKGFPKNRNVPRISVPSRTPLPCALGIDFQASAPIPSGAAVMVSDRQAARSLGVRTSEVKRACQAGVVPAFCKSAPAFASRAMERHQRGRIGPPNPIQPVRWWIPVFGLITLKKFLGK